MGRPRKASVRLGSLSACDQAMRDLLAATLRREALEGQMEAEIAAAKWAHERGIAAAVEEAKDLECALQQYWLEHVEDLESNGRRSVEMYWGVMGRRASPPALKLLNKSWTWAAVMERLREKFGTKYLRLKEAEVDKDAVKAGIAEERLNQFGLKLAQDEVFFAEPDRARAKELP